MDYCYVLIFLLIAGAGVMGCVTTTSVSDSCPILNIKQMLPAKNISEYQLVHFSDTLGSDFYRVLLKNNTRLLADIGTGVLAYYNSTRIPGATMNILIIDFNNQNSTEIAASILRDVVNTTISSNSTTQVEDISRNNISYSALRITGIANANGVEFYQEYVFWHVHHYTVMAKLTTPDIGQDPHHVMLQFIDAMASICSP
jgi:hypothetical protein